MAADGDLHEMDRVEINPEAVRLGLVGRRPAKAPAPPPPAPGQLPPPVEIAAHPVDGGVLGLFTAAGKVSPTASAAFGIGYSPLKVPGCCEHDDVIEYVSICTCEPAFEDELEFEAELACSTSKPANCTCKAAPAAEVNQVPEVEENEAAGQHDASDGGNANDDDDDEFDFEEQTVAVSPASEPRAADAVADAGQAEARDADSGSESGPVAAEQTPAETAPLTQPDDELDAVSAKSEALGPAPAAVDSRATATDNDEEPSDGAAPTDAVEATEESAGPEQQAAGVAVGEDSAASTGTAAPATEVDPEEQRIIKEMKEALAESMTSERAQDAAVQEADLATESELAALKQSGANALAEYDALAERDAPAAVLDNLYSAPGEQQEDASPPAEVPSIEHIASNLSGSLDAVHEADEEEEEGSSPVEQVVDEEGSGEEKADPALPAAEAATGAEQAIDAKLDSAELEPGLGEPSLAVAAAEILPHCASSSSDEHESKAEGASEPSEHGDEAAPAVIEFDASAWDEANAAAAAKAAEAKPSRGSEPLNYAGAIALLTPPSAYALTTVSASPKGSSRLRKVMSFVDKLRHPHFHLPLQHQHHKQLPASEVVFSLARTSLDWNDETHQRLLSGLFRTITGQAGPACPGPHWESIGFQRADPSTDLRDLGLLGPLQMLWLAETQPDLVQDLYRRSRDGRQEFPLMAASLNISLICLNALRSGANLSGGASPSALDAINALFAALWHAFHARWRTGDATIEDFPPLLRRLRERAQRSPRKLLRAASV